VTQSPRRIIIGALFFVLLGGWNSAAWTASEPKSTGRVPQTDYEKQPAEWQAVNGQRLTGRAFLVSGKIETSGYGFYSYLLLGERANDGNRDLYEALLSAYLKIEEANRFQGVGVGSRELNIIYLLLREKPPENPSVAWLLDHYDYDRAHIILKTLGDIDTGLPYIIAYATPLSEKSAIDPNNLLLLNFYGIPDDLAFLRLQEFLAQTGDRVRSGQRLTGRAFLATGENETSGYGLYSYLLLGQRANDGNRDLYEALFSAYLKIEKVSRFYRAGVECRELNITYLLLQERPPENPSVSWLLEHYDYARAQVLLRKLGEIDIANPYIISYSAPLSGETAINPKRLLLQNFSGIPDDLAFLWVQEFLAQARRPQYWDKRTLRRLMLSLRKNIAIVARAFGEVRKAHAEIEPLFETKIKMLN